MLTFFKRILAILGLLLIIMVGYLFVARPYQLIWGAEDQEISATLPGDEIIQSPDFFATRAITIHGTPQEIWPWIIQMGYNRAGFYGYDLLENLGSARGMLSAEDIIPEFQNFQVGDVVPISAVVDMNFQAIEPNWYLIWSGRDSEDSFLWLLQPIDSDRTRLISRIRWSYDWTRPQTQVLVLFTEFTDHIAVRKILMGVKGRVEGEIEPMAQQNAEFTLFVISVLVFITSLFLLLVRSFRWKRWLAGFGAGFAWLITWYAPISLWLGISFTVLAILGLYFAHRRSNRAIINF